jgi:hypothetical protein
MCIEPPLPLVVASGACRTARSSCGTGSAPLARVWPWPRWVDVSRSSRTRFSAHTGGHRLLAGGQVQRARAPAPAWPTPLRPQAADAALAGDFGRVSRRRGCVPWCGKGPPERWRILVKSSGSLWPRCGGVQLGGHRSTGPAGVCSLFAFRACQKRSWGRHSKRISWARSRFRTTPTTASRRSAARTTSTSPARRCRASRTSSWHFGYVKKAAAMANRDLGVLDGASPTRSSGVRPPDRRRDARPVHHRLHPGRRRHVDQHERQRGDRQPRARSSSATRRASTSTSIRTITSTSASRPTTSIRPRSAWR